MKKPVTLKDRLYQIGKETWGLKIWIAIIGGCVAIYTRQWIEPKPNDIQASFTEHRI